MDFVAPCNVEFSRKIGEELRSHRLAVGNTESEDVLQLSTMCWWFYKRWQTGDLRDVRSDPSSDPWKSVHSAAPHYLAVAVSSAGQ